MPAGSLLNLSGNEGEMARNLLTCSTQSSPPCQTNPEGRIFASGSQLCVPWPGCQTWGGGAGPMSACEGGGVCNWNSLKNQVLLLEQIVALSVVCATQFAIYMVIW